MGNISATTPTPDTNVSAPISVPNLPIAPDQYSSTYFNAFSNILRLFFTQAVSLVNAALRPQGFWNSIFQSGQVQYIGPNNELNGSNNLIFGTQLPNPSGIPAPGLLIGSNTPQAWIITDQSPSPVTNGVNLGITAGETQPSGNANGGQLFLIGGGSFGGTGGQLLNQGGTSLNGPGGSAILAGGNSTNGPPGDAFVIGGQTGTVGANVQIIMTNVNGSAGRVIIRVNSTTLLSIDQFGALYIGGTNAGTAGQVLHSGGPGAPMFWA